MSASQGSSATGSGKITAGPWGAREIVCGAGCLAAPSDARDRQQRMQRKTNQKNWWVPHCVQAAMLRTGRYDCGQSDLSQLKLSVKPGESNRLQKPRQ
jgi:hypothetical protein